MIIFPANIAKRYLPLWVSSVLLVGYLGYRIVYWIIRKTFLDKSIEKTFNTSVSPVHTNFSLKSKWWKQISESSDLKAYKKNWKSLAHDSEKRLEESKRFQSSYNNNPEQWNVPQYEAPFGPVYFIPNDFGFWMSGVALVASYLSAKKKIKHLHVCQNLEALVDQIKNINLNPKDQRAAYIVSSFSSRFLFWGYGPNFPQHKGAVCIEKKGGILSIALLDPMPCAANEKIQPQNITNDLWEGCYKWDKFNSQELVYRAIFKGCSNVNQSVNFYHSQVKRETHYGCEVFAIGDALSFLKDLDFFKKIECTPQTVKINSSTTIQSIITLPPEFMKGTQSYSQLKDYEKKNFFDQKLKGKAKSLRDHLKTYSFQIKGKEQNHTITKKLYQYLKIAEVALKQFKRKDIEQIINRTLIK